MNRIIIRLKIIKYKKSFFYYLFFKIIRSYFFLIFKPNFKFSLVDYTIKFCYNPNLKYYQSFKSKNC